MTVDCFANKCNFDVLCMPSPDREVNGVYIGDLLSWVMGRASCDNVWITIMSNVNIIAVAALADVSCILLTEGVRLDEDVISLAQEKGINVITSSLPTYETSKTIAAFIE